MIVTLYSIPALVASSSGSDDSYENNTSDQPPIQVAANVLTINDSIQLEILRILKELSGTIKKNQGNNHNEGQGYHRKTPKEGSKLRTNISKYYWTHRACAYSSADCPVRLRAKEHKTKASFQDKMNGSLARCE